MATAVPASPSTPLGVTAVDSSTFAVSSAVPGNAPYIVRCDVVYGQWTCSCPSHTKGGRQCKHIASTTAAGHGPRCACGNPAAPTWAVCTDCLNRPRCCNCGDVPVGAKGDVCVECLMLERVIEEQEGARPVRQSPIYRETLDALIRDADALAHAATFRSPNAPAIY